MCYVLNQYNKFKFMFNMLAVLFPVNNTELTNFVIFFSNNSCDLYKELTALGSDLSLSNDTSKL